MTNKILIVLVVILIINVFDIIINALFLSEITQKLNHLAKIEEELRAIRFNITDNNSCLKITNEYIDRRMGNIISVLLQLKDELNKKSKKKTK